MKPTISFLTSLFLVLTAQIISAQTGNTSAEQQDTNSLFLSESIAFSSSENHIDDSLLTNRPMDVSALDAMFVLNDFENSNGVDLTDDIMRNSSPGLTRRRGFRTSFTAGFPTGSESDFYRLKLALFAYYYVHLVSQNISLLAGGGYTRFTGKELSDGFKTDGVGFFPIQVGLRYHLAKNFGLMGALGYAFGTQEGINGLIFTIGVVYTINEILNLVLDYNGISVDGGSFNAVSAGVEVDLGF